MFNFLELIIPENCAQMLFKVFIGIFLHGEHVEDRIISKGMVDVKPYKTKFLFAFEIAHLLVV